MKIQKNPRMSRKTPNSPDAQAAGTLTLCGRDKVLAKIPSCLRVPIKERVAWPDPPGYRRFCRPPIRLMSQSRKFMNLWSAKKINFKYPMMKMRNSRFAIVATRISRK